VSRSGSPSRSPRLTNDRARAPERAGGSVVERAARRGSRDRGNGPPLGSRTYSAMLDAGPSRGWFRGVVAGPRGTCAHRIRSRVNQTRGRPTLALRREVSTVRAGGSGPCATHENLHRTQGGSRCRPRYRQPRHWGWAALAAWGDSRRQARSACCTRRSPSRRCAC
jgi:hypothetical protein